MGPRRRGRRPEQPWPEDTLRLTPSSGHSGAAVLKKETFDDLENLMSSGGWAVASRDTMRRRYRNAIRPAVQHIRAVGRGKAFPLYTVGTQSMSTNFLQCLRKAVKLPNNAHWYITTTNRIRVLSQAGFGPNLATFIGVVSFDFWYNYLGRDHQRMCEYTPAILTTYLGILTGYLAAERLFGKHHLVRALEFDRWSFDRTTRFNRLNKFSSSAAVMQELQQEIHGSPFYAASPQERLSNYIARSSVLHRAMERYGEDVVQLVFDIICQVELPGVAAVHQASATSRFGLVGRYLFEHADLLVQPNITTSRPFTSIYDVPRQPAEARATAFWNALADPEHQSNKAFQAWLGGKELDLGIVYDAVADPDRVPQFLHVVQRTPTLTVHRGFRKLGKLTWRDIE